MDRGGGSFRNNHYVPIWYQQRFIPQDAAERKFYYLDLDPQWINRAGHRYQRAQTLRWGPSRCFCERDLYTTSFGSEISTEIEEKFFGKVDNSAREALDYFANYRQGIATAVDREAFQTLLRYMSIQKLRTPKGLRQLARLINSSGLNETLYRLQQLQNLYCAIWTECVWAIADASQSPTKFLISDHPVTVYNRGCPPKSIHCQGLNDPDIRFSATQTFFPLSLDRILILTNLAWLRNPYGDPLRLRPNPKMLRPAVFNFQEIQTGRQLTEREVRQINYITKLRAMRYVAAGSTEWLKVNSAASTERWGEFGNGYLLMPDPRSCQFGGEIVIGYGDGHVEAYDTYGRRPGQRGYDDKTLHDLEWSQFMAFKGEFARLYGPIRRGRAFEMGRMSPEVDTPEMHQHHLEGERRNPKIRSPNNRQGKRK